MYSLSCLALSPSSLVFSPTREDTPLAAMVKCNILSNQRLVRWRSLRRIEVERSDDVSGAVSSRDTTNAQDSMASRVAALEPMAFTCERSAAHSSRLLDVNTETGGTACSEEAIMSANNPLSDA